MSARYAAPKARTQKTQVKALPAPASAKKATKAPSAVPKAPVETVPAKHPRRVLRCPCTGLGCSRTAFFTNPKFKEHALCTRCLRAAKRSLKEQEAKQKVIEVDVHEDIISESALVAEAHETDSCLFPVTLKPVQRKIALSRILVDGHFTLDKTVWDGCAAAFGGYEQMMCVFETVLVACNKAGAIPALT